MLSLAHYEAVKHVMSLSDVSILASKYPNIPYSTLLSILSQNYQAMLKRDYPKHRQALSSYVKRYKAGESILKIADSVRYSSVQLCRLLIEEILGVDRKDVAKYIKDPELILAEAPTPTQERLSYEVYCCVQNDTQCSPLVDIRRKELGEEYEAILERKLKQAHLPFMSEDEMKQVGFAKTPDVRMLAPFAVGSFIVNWIDSKALFANLAIHQEYLDAQYHAYFNRFGPGLVIYWAGFVESILDLEDKEVLVLDGFPRPNMIRSIHSLLDILDSQPLSIANTNEEDNNANVDPTTGLSFFPSDSADSASCRAPSSCFASVISGRLSSSNVLLTSSAPSTSLASVSFTSQTPCSSLVSSHDASCPSATPSSSSSAASSSSSSTGASSSSYLLTMSPVISFGTSPPLACSLCASSSLPTAKASNSLCFGSSTSRSSHNLSPAEVARPPVRRKPPVRNPIGKVSPRALKSTTTTTATATTVVTIERMTENKTEKYTATETAKETQEPKTVTETTEKTPIETTTETTTTTAPTTVTAASTGTLTTIPQSSAHFESGPIINSDRSSNHAENLSLEERWRRSKTLEGVYEASAFCCIALERKRKERISRLPPLLSRANSEEELS